MCLNGTGRVCGHLGLAFSVSIYAVSRILYICIQNFVYRNRYIYRYIYIYIYCIICIYVLLYCSKYSHVCEVRMDMHEVVILFGKLGRAQSIWMDSSASTQPGPICALKEHASVEKIREPKPHKKHCRSWPYLFIARLIVKDTAKGRWTVEFVWAVSCFVASEHRWVSMPIGFAKGRWWKEGHQRRESECIRGKA